MPKFLKNLLIFLLMIAIGVIATIIIKKNKKVLVHEESQMKARPVDVLTVKKQPFTSEVVVYGNVEPAIVLQGKAEVSGKVSYTHPELKKGGSIAKGEVVIRIDADDYQVSLKQTKADLLSTKAQRKQLEQEQSSTRRSLKLAEANLSLGQQELQRVKGIWDKHLIARSTLDAEEQKVIKLRQTIEDLRGKLATYSSRLNSAKANISRSQQQVKGKETTLGRTEIRMPFDARISAVNVEKGQFTTLGGTLFEAINTDGVEVKAEVPIRQMQALLSSLNGKAISLNAANFAKAISSLQLKAKLSLVGGSPEATWDARVVRFSESIDPIRRTLGITVAVDKPYDKVVIGKRPPLLKGMYVAVSLSSPAYDAIVIPRKAIHLGRAYLLDEKSQLTIQPVDIMLEQGEKVVVSKGLQEGDQVIINDLIPIIVGMPLVSSSKSEQPSSKGAK